MLKKNKEPLVSIIIVNWNGERYLSECLDSLSKIEYKNAEIVFVDNASFDGSVGYVERNFPEIKIIKNKKNLGVSEGYNVGFKHSKGDAILMLNTDILFKKDLINTLVKVLYSQEKFGAVQPKLVLFPQKNIIDSVGSLFLTNGLLYHFGREKNPNLPLYNRQMEIFSTKGACMLIKREVLKITGFFDKDFFAYSEDTDLCMRIWLAGYKIIYTPKTTVYHKGGGASEQMISSFILFHAYKNAIYMYLKNLSAKYLLKVIPRMIFLYELAFLAYIIKGNYQHAYIIQKAIGWNILNIKRILQKRKMVQEKIRIISDDAFLPKLTRKVKLSYYYYQFFGGMEKYMDIS